MNWLTIVFNILCVFLLILIITEIVRGLKELWSDFS
jgi:hypothetical protein